MRIKKIFILIGVIFLLFYGDVVWGQTCPDYPIQFRSGSDIINRNYSTNSREIAAIKQLISDYEDVILTGNGHIRLVAPIGSTEDPTTINLAARRASVVRNFFKQNFRMLTNWSFSFYFDNTRDYNNTIEVQYVPYALPAEVSPVIHYAEQKSSVATIRKVLARYGELPYLSSAQVLEENERVRAHFDEVNALASNPVDVAPQEGEPNPEKSLIAIHFRWDKDHLDSLYLSNSQNLRLLDSILTSRNLQYIDTLTIVAHASPEGAPDYNKRLSERRAKTIKSYITANYKAISPDRIVTEARGENWEGLRNFAVRDMQLPSRDEVLRIIDSPLSSQQRQSQIRKLNGGVTYYRYILPNYYRYLRNGASVLVTYSPDLPVILPPITAPAPRLIVALDPIGIPIPNTREIVRYPIAFRTNLVYDMVGALNLGIEVPIGRHFSVLADFAYSYWHTPSDLYALQLRQYGVEGRYWFGVSDRKKEKNPEWAKPLRGWNVGVYGVYCSRYDVQWIDGFQGDRYCSVGITGGYATPIARNLSLEFSLSAGYFYTAEYRHYHQPEYGPDGKKHLMWQETGRFSAITLTSARISLVWLIRTTTKKGGER